MQTVKFVHWQDGDAFLGYLLDYPDYWTQGDSLDDLKNHLADLYQGSGCVLVRHGRRHDWYRNPTTGSSQPVPRHREIKEYLARHIIAVLGNPPDEAGDVADDTP